MSGILLGSRDAEVTKTVKNLCAHGAYIPEYTIKKLTRQKE